MGDISEEEDVDLCDGENGQMAHLMVQMQHSLMFEVRHCC
jgi:hypothetical protein